MHWKHFSTVLCRGERPTALHMVRPIPSLRFITLLMMVCFRGSLGAQGRPDGDTLRVSLRDARAAALRTNPDLRAIRLDTAIARGTLRQAALPRFNPTADVLAGVGANGSELGLSQEVEIFGQRGVRMSAARAAVTRARAGIADATRLTIGDVDRTFYRLVAATRRTDLADEVLALNQRVTDVASRQLAAGEISKLDYNLAVVELGRSRALALATRREGAHVATEFGRLLGVPLGTRVVPIIDSTQHPPPADSARVIPHDVVPVLDHANLLNIDSLTTRALARRPDLAAQSAAVEQAMAEASLTRREGLPNLVARVASEPRASGTGRAIRPGVGISLPFLNRNQGDAESRRAAASQAVFTRVALVSHVRAEIASTVASYQSAAAEVEVLESTVLTPARQNRQLLETAYREGKVGLPVLLLIRNQVIAAELDYWTAWLAEREALSTLNEATGDNMPTDITSRTSTP